MLRRHPCRDSGRFLYHPETIKGRLPWSLNRVVVTSCPKLPRVCRSSQSVNKRPLPGPNGAVITIIIPTNNPIGRQVINGALRVCSVMHSGMSNILVHAPFADDKSKQVHDTFRSRTGRVTSYGSPSYVWETIPPFSFSNLSITSGWIGFVVSPRPASALFPACRIFPFCLCRQAILVTRALGKPLTIQHCSLPGHLVNGRVVSTFHRNISTVLANDGRVGKRSDLLHQINLVYFSFLALCTV